MVTGAGGAIGTHLCRHLRRHAPAALYQVDNDARRLRRLEREGDTAAGEAVVADVTDPAEVERVMAWLRPDIVFHAAGASAGTPPQLVMANVCGTMNLAAAAVRARTPRFVLVSSDHAADPESALGATQRLAELAVQSLFGASGAAQPTVFSIARLGHVIDADGSLLSMVAAQAIAAVPVTLSHPDATSFLMTTREAVGLILQAASMAESAETFVFDSGRATPAVELVRRYAAQLHLPEVTIRFAAVEGGRRRYAKLLSDAETRVPTAYPFIAATRAARLPSGVGELLRALCETAAGHQAEGAGDAVRSMMQRILPEYRPREATR
jgi:FlaA1/EpsC-like NDP-sugar epimerase